MPGIHSGCWGIRKQSLHLALQFHSLSPFALIQVCWSMAGRRVRRLLAKPAGGDEQEKKGHPVLFLVSAPYVVGSCSPGDLEVYKRQRFQAFSPLIYPFHLPVLQGVRELTSWHRWRWTLGHEGSSLKLLPSQDALSESKQRAGVGRLLRFVLLTSTLPTPGHSSCQVHSPAPLKSTASPCSHVDSCGD